MNRRYTAKVCVDGMRFFFVQIEVHIQVRIKCEACGKGTAWLHKQPLDLAQKEKRITMTF